MLERVEASPPDPGRRDASRGVKWAFTACVVLPLSYALAEVLQSGPSPYRLLSLGAFTVGLAVALGPWRRPPPRERVGLAALFAAAGQFVTLADAWLGLFFLASGVTWLAAGVWLFALGAHRSTVAAMNVGLLALSVFVLEAAFPVPSISGAVTWYQDGRLGERDPEVGSRLIPNAVARHRAVDGDGNVVFDVAYNVGDDRSRVVPGRPSLGPEWWLAGGSFLFGHGLEDHETIPAVTQAASPTVRVYNLGHSGFGTAEVYLLLRRLYAEGRTPSLLVYFLMDSHFWRTSCVDAQVALEGRDRPCMEVVDGRLEISRRSSDISSLSVPHRINIWLLERSGLWNRVAGRTRFVAASVYPVTQALVLEMDRQCRQAEGCRFLLVRIPRESPESEAGDLRDWKADLTARGVEILDLKERFDSVVGREPGLRQSYFIPLDGHPSAAYTALMAKWLLEYLKAEA